MSVVLVAKHSTDATKVPYRALSSANALPSRQRSSRSSQQQIPPPPRPHLDARHCAEDPAVLCSSSRFCGYARTHTMSTLRRAAPTSRSGESRTSDTSWDDLPLQEEHREDECGEEVCTDDDATSQTSSVTSNQSTNNSPPNNLLTTSEHPEQVSAGEVLLTEEQASNIERRLRAVGVDCSVAVSTTNSSVAVPTTSSSVALPISSLSVI